MLQSLGQQVPKVKSADLLGVPETLLENHQIHNYFLNNTKTLFAFFILILLQVHNGVVQNMTCEIPKN